MKQYAVGIPENPVVVRAVSFEDALSQAFTVNPHLRASDTVTVRFLHEGTYCDSTVNLHPIEAIGMRVRPGKAA